MEGHAIKNIIQKVIRSIELNGDPKTNTVKYIENDRNVSKYKHTVNDSEMLRAVEAIDGNHVYSEKYGSLELVYIECVISVNVGYNVPKFKVLSRNNGILVLQHWKWVNKNDGKMDDDKKPLSPLYKLEKCIDDEGNQVTERFKRVIVGSGHNRGKKALFIREDLFEKLHKIFLGGMDEYAYENGYPYFKKGYAKWNSYYGLPSTDSKPVFYVPNIVIIKDFERTVEDTFDTVIQTKRIKKGWKAGDDEKDKYIKKYSVKSANKKQCDIMPFDGAGLVSVECAEKWSEELGIKNEYGKNYIPAAFQIRVIPGIKGNLYTFDIKQFAEENGWVITDIKNEKHDLRQESVDIILTESQTKFIKLFDNDVKKWRVKFDAPVVFYKKDENGNETDEVECSYKRTFNISEYSEDTCDIKHRMLTAYQHLLTVNFEDEEIKTFTDSTIKMLSKISCDVNEFLRFRSCTLEEEEDDKKSWKRIPPYYRAAYYASEVNKPIIFADDYFKRKVREDINGIIKRVLSGKLYITGNYQVLTPDIYALAQYAFGKRDNEVTGLLQSEEIYSNWWIYQNEKTSKKKSNEFCCDRLALIRNPHIYMEARIATMVSEKIDKSRYELIKKWFKYQTSGILTDSFSTIPLALGTADFDGDHIATTNCVEYINAVERARSTGNGNTVDFECVDLTNEKSDASENMPDVSNIQKLMEFDALAYQNNIGTVIDKVTNLWGIAQDKANKKQIQEYIKIMDIIGQLTIDAAKSGEFEAIPDDIKDFLKNNHILKPYFMRYLQKNEQRERKESVGIKNAQFFFEGQDEIADNQMKFSNENISLNRICHYLEGKLQKIDTDISANEFDLEKFLKIFCTSEPNITSPLYRKLLERLSELIKEHKDLSQQMLMEEDKDAKDEKTTHYRYFYIYARNELLKECKLSEETSINKVLNCIVYMCYRDKRFIDDDGAKNILWNCFDNEMIRRAKEDYTDKQIDFSNAVERAKKTKELKDRKLAKYQKKKEFCIMELEEKDKYYPPIIVAEEDICMIHELISDDNLRDNGICLKYEMTLKKLYGILIVISKRMESDRWNSKSGTISHYINRIAINENGNNRLNYSNLSNLCGFTDYERKHIRDRLKDLLTLNVIEISDKRTDKIRLRVVYEKTNLLEAEDSLVNPDDYKQACTDIIEQIQKTKKLAVVS